MGALCTQSFGLSVYGEVCAAFRTVPHSPLNVQAVWWNRWSGAEPDVSILTQAASEPSSDTHAPCSAPDCSAAVLSHAFGVPSAQAACISQATAATLHMRNPSMPPCSNDVASCEHSGQASLSGYGMDPS